MFQSIEIAHPHNFTREDGDFVVFVGQRERDQFEGADYSLWHEAIDLGDTPKEIKEGKYVYFDWSKHATPLRREIKRAHGLKRNTRLVFVSDDDQSDAMALALATSECNIFKGQFTKAIFEKYYITSVDRHIFLEFLGLKSKFYEVAKKFLPSVASSWTRYELLGEINSREVIHLTTAMLLGRDYSLIDYETRERYKPEPKNKYWR